MLLMLSLLGCKRFESADELTGPVMMQGIYLGIDIEEWLPQGVDIGDGDETLGAFAHTALCETFVAYISGTGSLADAPVEGLDMNIHSDIVRPELRLKEQEGGRYRATSVDGLDYEPKDEVEVFGDVEGGFNALAGLTPVSPDYSVPTRIRTDDDIEIDLRNGDYDNLIVGVYHIEGLEGGEMTYDNLPSGFEDIYEFTHPKRAVQTDVIDGREAFHKPGLYILGVAGMKIAPTHMFSGVNTTLSAFMAGQISLRLITVE